MIQDEAEYAVGVKQVFEQTITTTEGHIIPKATYRYALWLVENSTQYEREAF